MLNLGFEENEAVSFKDHKGKITFLGILFFFFQKPTFFLLLIQMHFWKMSRKEWSSKIFFRNASKVRFY